MLIWPSVWPLDHGRAMAAQTAALSLVTPLANDATRLARARIRRAIVLADGIRCKL